MSHSFDRSSWGFGVIGAYKLAKALLVLLAGIVLLRVQVGQIAARLVDLAAWLRVDQDNRIFQAGFSWVAGVGRGHLKAAGLGAILFSLLYLAEGIGLLLKRRWGAYLVIVTTGFLIPLEAYEVVRKVTWPRVTALGVNVGIVAYLVVKLKPETDVMADT